MRYRTKLLIAAGLLLAMSLSAAGLAYWGVAESHRYLTRSRVAHEQLERQLQLSRHSQQLFKAWTDTLLTGMTDRPLGAAYLNKVIESDLSALEDLSKEELAIVEGDEHRAESAEIDRLAAIRREYQHTLDQLAEVEKLRSRGRPDIAWQNLIQLLKGGIDQKLNELIEVAVADETAEVLRIDADAARLLSRLERISQIHAGLAILATLAIVVLLVRGLRTPLAELLRGTRTLAEGHLSHRIAVSGRDEFAELGRSFNSMATDLQAHQQALQDAHANLETIVEERTEELRRANESLRKIDETRRGFFADISHELRTPLTIIRGEGEIALRGKNKRIAEYKHSIDRIVEQAKHLSVLVNDLLFIARQGAGAARLNLQTIDLSALVEKVCGDAKVIAHDKAIDIALANGSSHEMVQGDPARLRQLFLVLLDNAVRYSRSKSAIKVEVGRSDGDVTVRVSDRGVGIAPEELDGVFERFRRGGNASNMNEEGLGLGLPLAKAIVEAHKGKIKMESRVGEGTTVTVALPAGTQGDVA
ncbi:MAG: sensor histidine kinase [Methyloceanibacter sp.]|uniref:sensor histidine kinase n=1 Tax=Methyloceanibacter sp. TaxID=1965321 RepID=UPI003D6D5897